MGCSILGGIGFSYHRHQDCFKSYQMAFLQNKEGNKVCFDLGSWNVSLDQASRPTLSEANVFRSKGTFEGDFPYPKVGYVSSLVGTTKINTLHSPTLNIFQLPDAKFSETDGVFKFPWTFEDNDPKISTENTSVSGSWSMINWLFWTIFSGWWFQPIWKILVKLDIFPK